MLDDDVRIRSALPEEAEELSELAWRSKEYMEYSPKMLRSYSDFLNISEEFIENNATFVLENEENNEIAGFYSIEKIEDKWWLRKIWVSPEYIGTGVGGALYLHACETAETMGVAELYAFCDFDAVEFYLHMGAEEIGETEYKMGTVTRKFPTFRIKL